MAVEVSLRLFDPFGDWASAEPEEYEEYIRTALDDALPGMEVLWFDLEEV